MLKIFFLILLMVPSYIARAQQGHQVINSAEVQRIEKALSSDDMQGRKAGTPGNRKAADFIIKEFKRVGLEYGDAKGFEQEFTLVAPSRDSGKLRDTAKEPATGKLANIVGILPGKSRKDEYVIFSAHYDHLGTGKAVGGDSIFNGANDDATGVTAVIMLADYFKKTGGNERTLVFAAFNAEETGGFGSRYFAKQFDAGKVMAMFNIEMIGTDSKWGKNAAYITGYDKSNMGETLQKNLEGTGFRFYPDPYPDQRLFYRSDNASLARLGVPAHTISTSKMDDEKHYHTVNDEIETLDMVNMTAIIQAIALSSVTIIKGNDTPSRVAIERE